MLLVITCSAVFYFLLNDIIKKTSRKHCEETDKRKKWMIENLTCSLWHSIISALWTLLCIFNEPHFILNFLETKSTLAAYLIASSLGYFCYDTLNIIFNDGTRQLILLGHHVLILVAFSYCVSTVTCQGFAISSLLMEFNSIFLHRRKLMKLHKVNTNKFSYFLNSILLLITMIFFRILLAVYVTYYLINNRDVITWIPFTIGTSGACILIPINIGLCYRIYKTDYCKTLC